MTFQHLEMTMTPAIRPALALVFLAASVVSTHADWEGTQWGMSPEAALSVMEGAQAHQPAASEIFEFDGAKYDPLVITEHSIGGIAGEAALLFDSDKALQFVAFSPTNLTQCDALAQALAAIHGSTEPSGFGSTAIYNWDDGVNVVRLTNSFDIGICNLTWGSH